MDSVSGDKFIDDCARYIRFNEARLSQSNNSSSATSAAVAWVNPTTWLRTTSPPANGPSARVVQARPTPLRLTSHHLYYLLIRFEALGISTGPLDVQIPSTSRPSSYFAFISNNVAGSGSRRKDRDDTMSISSLQTTMSALSSFGLGNAQTNGGWWGGKKQDISIEIKYIYSAMTKIPALRIVPPPVKLIQDFEDCPGELSIPLDVFKNVQFVEFEDTDPRSFIGWDRLSAQLKSLTIKRSGVEDITDIIVDAVVMDERRRRGERVRHRRRKVHSSMSQEDDRAGGGDNVVEAQLTHPPLPSLAWHFLRHLSLADNSLTFLPSSCLSCLSRLSSLDLSNNLLNAVPPSLHLLPHLQSLNLTNNLIDSVAGIPHALLSIQALNLSHNRLESLCGLERLSTLMRIDLRKNEIYEAGEVGRLATLPKIVEVYIAGNPLLEEVEDARVDIFAEFAKEGNDLETLKLDNEGIGYFEKQRVRERIPHLDRLVNRNRETTPAASETDINGLLEAESRVKGSSLQPLTGQDAEPVIKTVRHRNTHSKAIQKSNAARRNRRIVELESSGDSSIQKDESAATKSVVATNEEEVSDSDAIKRAALAGDMDTALGTNSRKEYPTLSSTTQAQDRSPMSTLSKKTGATQATTSKDWDISSVSSDQTQKAKGQQNMRIRSLEVSHPHSSTMKDESREDNSEVIVPGPRSQIGRKQVDLTQRSKVTMSLHDASSPDPGDTNLRKKIEALKGEVGDDWLRLLARGESVYVPSEEEEEQEGPST